MRISAALVMLLTVCFALCGCVPQESLFGLADGTSVGFEPKLLGKWLFLENGKPSEKKSYMVIKESAKGKSYDITILNFADNGQTIVTSAELVTIGRFLFLDFHTPEADRKLCSKYFYPVLGAHVFARVSIEQNRVSLRFMQDDWAEKQAKAGQLEIANIKTGDEILLVAQTEELQRFALKYAEDKEAFSDYFLLTREK